MFERCRVWLPRIYLFAATSTPEIPILKTYMIISLLNVIVPGPLSIVELSSSFTRRDEEGKATLRLALKLSNS